MRNVWRAALLASAMAASGLQSGCISVKADTTHEIKPIQITMDINLNLKVQKELEDFLNLD